MTAVKMILRSDVSGLGKRGDIVEVSKGYARNFLAPRSLAFPATDGATAQAEAMRRSRDLKDAKDGGQINSVSEVTATRSAAPATTAALPLDGDPYAGE